MDEHRYLLYFGWYANKEAALEALLEGHFDTPHRLIITMTAAS
jgi:hypothetical protein